MGCFVAALKYPKTFLSDEIAVQQKAKSLFAEDENVQLNNIEVLENAVDRHLLAIYRNMEYEGNKTGQLSASNAYHLIKDQEFELSSGVEKIKNQRQ